MQVVKIEREWVFLQEVDLLSLNWPFSSLALPSYASERKTPQEDTETPRRRHVGDRRGEDIETKTPRYRGKDV